MVDYEDLLKRYIKHVGECEGTTYLQDWHRDFMSARELFSNEAWGELQRIDQEAFPGTN